MCPHHQRRRCALVGAPSLSSQPSPINPTQPAATPPQPRRNPNLTNGKRRKEGERAPVREWTAEDKVAAKPERMRLSLWGGISGPPLGSGGGFFGFQDAGAPEKSGRRILFFLGKRGIARFFWRWLGRSGDIPSKSTWWSCHYADVFLGNNSGGWRGFSRSSIRASAARPSVAVA